MATDGVNGDNQSMPWRGGGNCAGTDVYLTVSKYLRGEQQVSELDKDSNRVQQSKSPTVNITQDQLQVQQYHIWHVRMWHIPNWYQTILLVRNYSADFRNFSYFRAVDKVNV